MKLAMFVPITSFLCVIFALILLCVFESYCFTIEKDLVFRLYTHEDPVMYYALSKNGPPLVSETPFNPNRPTRIFVHGFKSKEKVIRRYKDAFLGIGDYNFIAVDWIEGASTYNYFSAKGRVRPVRSLTVSINAFKRLI